MKSFISTFARIAAIVIIALSSGCRHVGAPGGKPPAPAPVWESAGWTSTLLYEIPERDMTSEKRHWLTEDGKLFSIYRWSDAAFSVMDGKAGRKYDDISSWPSDVRFIGGRPAFIAKADFAQFVVWGDKEGKHYQRVGGFPSLREAGDKPVYIAHDAEQEFVVWGDKEGKRYDGVDSLWIVGGKPFYSARQVSKKSGHRCTEVRRFPVWGEEEGKEPPEEVQPTALPEASAPKIVRTECDKWAVEWMGRLGKSYEFIRGDVRLVADRPLYRAETSAFASVAVWGDHESGPYFWVDSLSVAEERPMYLARVSGGGERVIWGDMQSGGYDQVFSLAITDREISYGASIGRRVYRVSRPISAH